MHLHDSYEFFLHVHGGQQFQVDQHIVQLQPSQLLVIPPRQVHGTIGGTPLKDYERYCIHVRPSLLEQLRSGGVSLRDVVDQHCTGKPAQAYLSPQECMRINALASSVPTAGEIRTPLEHIEATSYLGALLSLFCQTLAQPSRRAAAVPSDSLMQDIHNYILERFAEDCSLDALSDRFSISKYHLSHRFSQTYQISLHQFVLRCRISYAQLLIRQGEPMMSVFYQCGFNDYSSFVRAFSRMTGSSPRLWRRQQLNQASRTTQI